MENFQSIIDQSWVGPSVTRNNSNDDMRVIRFEHLNLIIDLSISRSKTDGELEVYLSPRFTSTEISTADAMSAGAFFSGVASIAQRILWKNGLVKINRASNGQETTH